jgi:pSer/pThr/pTyr-binding forkhead associated (FHA) protein
MKLFFPNGEHAQYALKEGVTLVGSAAECDIRLDREGIMPAHCSIELKGGQGRLFDVGRGARVLLNGRPVADEAVLRPGDLLAFASVHSRLVAVERGAAVPTPAPAAQPVDDVGRTKVRMAVPKHILRGVSGSTFGKNFPVFGTMTIGRMSDCEISIPSEEISRRHVRLQTLPEGLMVEDLGSSNGTYINDERIHKAVLKPGDELRLDTLRFLLVAPGMDPTIVAQKRERSAAPAAGTGGVKPWVWVIVAVAVLAAAGLGLRLAGVI